MRKLFTKAINPLRLFFSDSRAVGVILLACTIFSLVLANAPTGNWYRSLWSTEMSGHLPIHLPGSFGHWINDFLMAFFFLLAGMEIKRELLSGELSSFKKAVLPFGAALGGMVAPALIFLLFNANSVYTHGWGIPTATDIAFSLGVASLFGKRVPVGLKILLMALAIIDDLGAIVVIALFYGGKLQLSYLAISAGLYAILWICNVFKIRYGIFQVLVSFALWYTILNSGVEASITGVLVAFSTPVKMLPKIEKAIYWFVNFIIIPLFALANTAILIPSDIIGSLNTSISVGIIFGLVLGKPIGIFMFSRLLVGLGWAKLPQNVEWKQILGMGTLAGIGFTMSIFTTALAFKDESARDIAKIAILLSVVTSLVVSWVYFILAEKISSKYSISQTATKHTPEMAMG